MTTPTDRLHAFGIEVPEVEEYAVQCGYTHAEGQLNRRIPVEFSDAAISALVTVLENLLVFEAGMQAGADSLRAEVDRQRKHSRSLDKTLAKVTAERNKAEDRSELAMGCLRVRFEADYGSSVGVMAEMFKDWLADLARRYEEAHHDRT